MSRMVFKSLVLFISLWTVLAAQDAEKKASTFANRLDDMVPRLLEENMVPGAAVALIQNGEVVFAKGYGHANVAQGETVTTRTGFNIGSISKTVAAWGVMHLVEQGKLKLDEPVATYLTRWQLTDTEFDAAGVTVRRLLSHTAGLSLHGYPGFGPDDQLPAVEASLSGVPTSSNRWA
jgi:CubicO group peptidase (beta-lactamase class C family)